MNVPFRVWVDWALWLVESVAAEFRPHFHNSCAAILAFMWPVIDNPGTPESKHCISPSK